MITNIYLYDNDTQESYFDGIVNHVFNIFFHLRMTTFIDLYTIPT